jgi:hypothetical protein
MWHISRPGWRPNDIGSRYYISELVTTNVSTMNVIRELGILWLEMSIKERRSWDFLARRIRASCYNAFIKCNQARGIKGLNFLRNP